MRAIGFQQPGGIDRNEALIDVGLPTPKPERRDLLVNVKAVSVNPVDTKKRKVIQPAPGAWQVLSWDAAGVVVAIGADVTLFFQRGDTVFYAGAIDRPGTNACAESRFAFVASTSCLATARRSF